MMIFIYFLMLVRKWQLKVYMKMKMNKPLKNILNTFSFAIELLAM